MGATNPLENCIIAIRADLANYVKDNNDREEVKTRCCLFRMHLAGHDSVLAARKLALAENVIYTLDQIRNSDQTSRADIETYKPHHAAKLAYDAFLQGFARVQNCLQSAIETESKMNVGRNTAGLLAQALQRGLQTFEREWATAKEVIWQMPELRGQEGIFEYSQANKAVVLRSFDVEMANKRTRFTAIMAKPMYNNMGTFTEAPPPFNQQPAYAVKI